MSTFKKATKTTSRLRAAFVGPSGSGKTYSALAVGSVIARARGGRMAVIDSERGSASKYASIFDFDVLDLESFHPETYCAALRDAAKEGYVVGVIDSLSHAWMGKDGALDQVDKAQKRSKSANSFAAWRDVTPMHNALVDAMLACPFDLIATMRSKTEYVLETVNGKTVPRKVGMAPIQRDGLEYEFDVVGDLDYDNSFAVSKTRCPALRMAVIDRPGEQLATTLLAWLSDGAQPEPRVIPEPSATMQLLGVDADAFEVLLGEIESAKSPTDLNNLMPRLAALPDSWKQIARDRWRAHWKARGWDKKTNSASAS